MNKAEEIYRAEMNAVAVAVAYLQESMKAIRYAQDGLDEALVQSNQAGENAIKAANALQREINRDNPDGLRDLVANAKDVKNLSKSMIAANDAIHKAIRPMAKAVREIRQFKLDV